MPIVLKSGSLNLLEHFGPVQACMVIALPLPLPSRDIFERDVDLHVITRVGGGCRHRHKYS